jgi:rhodanese-related sulfurtransferase
LDFSFLSSLLSSRRLNLNEFGASFGCELSLVAIKWSKTGDIKKIKSEIMPDTEIELIDKNCLISELRSCSSNSPNKKEIIILDCRSANDYAASHIKQSANISIPTIMLRRLKEGKIDIFSTIKCKDLKNRILGMDIQTLFVLYHNSPAQSSPDIIQILSRKLMAEFNDKKIRVVCLAGE